MRATAYQLDRHRRSFEAETSAPVASNGALPRRAGGFRVAGAVTAPEGAPPRTVQPVAGAVVSGDCWRTPARCQCRIPAAPWHCRPPYSAGRQALLGVAVQAASIRPVAFRLSAHSAALPGTSPSDRAARASGPMPAGTPSLPLRRSLTSCGSRRDVTSGGAASSRHWAGAARRIAKLPLRPHSVLRGAGLRGLPVLIRIVRCAASLRGACSASEAPHHYQMPPRATVTASPFTPPAASLHRNAMTCATSRGSSTRFCG